ncbi:unnamed protein product [Medioppia subpectinata]|uniref:Uncharacterized protein n=1 Tax=Medioppia subpectinata TaxID=1979941 RepID=A0A7R9KFX3_9ACAR|nr:unnamed protein product [Medioppia subpectinata]CAG2102818.1 unnamed protein product [Medioppia subpectinata]
MFVIIKIIALLVSVWLRVSLGAKCPPSPTIAPCSCAQYINQISCWNIKPDVNLTQIFVNLTKALGKNSKQIIYDEFKLIDSELTDIGSDDDSVEDFFAGVAFNKIQITKNRKLKRIHNNVFKSSFNITTSITISENAILANDAPNERQIFDLLNSFEFATEIWLTDNNISTIPEKAFNRSQNSLAWLSFIDNNIVSVGSHAFYSLPALNYILLDGNRIDKISNKAFELSNNVSNYQLLRLFLRDNDLNSDSFESGTFERIHRKLLLDLSKNNITHLKRDVFTPVFRRNGSAIILRHNPLVCDCNFKWLYDRRLLYNSSHHDRHYYVHNIQCNGTKHDGFKMNELTQSHFQHCPHDPTVHCFMSTETDYDYQC